MTRACPENLRLLHGTQHAVIGWLDDREIDEPAAILAAAGAAPAKRPAAGDRLPG